MPRTRRRVGANRGRTLGKTVITGWRFGVFVGGSQKKIQDRDLTWAVFDLAFITEARLERDGLNRNGRVEPNDGLKAVWRVGT